MSQTKTRQSSRTSGPAVSVVVATCNRSEPLRACLDALARQTCGDFEIIVVDDGSRDATDETVAAFRAAHPEVALRYLANAENLGANPSRNRGIRASRAALIALIDDDCTADPDWLENLVAGFTSDRVAAVTGLVENRPPRNLCERTLRGTQRVAGGEDATRLVGCNMAVRRELLLRHLLDEDRAAPAGRGVPDMRVSGRGDEEGLFLLLKAEGRQIRVVPAARVVHHHGHSWRSFFKQAYRSGRSAARLVYKYYLPPRIDLLPFLLAYATLPLAVWRPSLLWLPLAFFLLALLALAYNDLFRKRKGLLETLLTFPLLLAYYHVRLVGYVVEGLRLRLGHSTIERRRLG